MPFIWVPAFKRQALDVFSLFSTSPRLCALCLWSVLDWASVLPSCHVWAVHSLGRYWVITATLFQCLRPKRTKLLRTSKKILRWRDSSNMFKPIPWKLIYQALLGTFLGLHKEGLYSPQKMVILISNGENEDEPWDSPCSDKPLVTLCTSKLCHQGARFSSKEE